MPNPYDAFQNNVENTVKKVENAQKTEGTRAAYKALRKEFENFVNNPQNNQSTDMAFLSAVNAQLGGEMRNLSLAWGSEQLEPGHANSGKELNIQNIYKDGFKADYDKAGNLVTPFDLAMSQTLMSQYGELATSRPVLGIFGHRYISKGDLDSRINKIDQFYQKQNEGIKAYNEDKPIAQTLLANNARLFSTLESAANGGVSNGKVTKEELGNFIKNYQDNPNSALAKSVDTYQMSVINQLYKNWDTPEIKSLHPNGYISVNSMAESLGYADSQSMINDFNAPTAAPLQFNNWDNPHPAAATPPEAAAHPAAATAPEAAAHPAVATPPEGSSHVPEQPHKPLTPPNSTEAHPMAKLGDNEYSVKPGDNFWKIARKLNPSEHDNNKLGGFVKEMEKLNPHIKNFNLIRPGEKIKLPGQTPVSKDTPTQPGVTKSSSPEVTKPNSPEAEVTKPNSSEVTKPSSPEAQTAKSELFGKNSGSGYSVKTETYTTEAQLNPTSPSSNNDTPIIVPAAKVQSEKTAINPNDLNVKADPIITDIGTSQNIKIATDLLANNGKLYNDINSVTSANQISQSGLQAYIAYVKGNPESSLAKDVSAEQFRAVENLANNWNSTDIQKMVDKNGNMSPDSIAIGLGDRNSVAVNSPLLNPAEKNFEYLRQTDGNIVNTLFANNSKIYNDINSVTSAQDLSQSGLEAYVEYVKGNPQSRLANDVSPEQFQIIQNLAQNWNTSDVQSLLNKNGTLNLDSVSQGLGYSNNQHIENKASSNKTTERIDTGNVLIDGSTEAKNKSQITGNPLIDGYFANP